MLTPEGTFPKIDSVEHAPGYTGMGEQKEEVAVKNDMIAQERAETQNLVIVRYWQISRLDRLYAAAEHEEAEDRKNLIEQKNNGNANADISQLVIEAPPEYSTSTALIKLPIVSLGELDASLNQIRESPRDMLRVSESVIDPLLERWTRWQEIRDRQEVRPSGRYTPSVHSVYEPDEKKPKQYGDFYNKEDSLGGYYIEGTTTDWRKPHSAAAKQEAARRRKKYAGLQPSVSVESSDVEDNQGPRRPKKPAPSRHVIDSSTETSDSEPDLPLQRRRSHAESSNDKRPRYPPQRPNPPRMYGNGGDTRANAGGRNSSSPNSTPSTSVPRSPVGTRPMTNPVQTQYHHAFTSPLPPVHTSNAPILPALPEIQPLHRRQAHLLWHSARCFYASDCAPPSLDLQSTAWCRQFVTSAGKAIEGVFHLARQASAAEPWASDISEVACIWEGIVGDCCSGLDTQEDEGMSSGWAGTGYAARKDLVH